MFVEEPRKTVICAPGENIGFPSVATKNTCPEIPHESQKDKRPTTAIVDKAKIAFFFVAGNATSETGHPR